MNRNNVKLGVIGCGKMAGAILEGVFKSKFISSDNIFLFDVAEEAKNNLADKFNFNKTESIKELLSKTNTILLAVKPFVINNVLDEIKKDYNNQLILSIIAGAKIEKYQSFLPEAKIVRIMPNTPALVNQGMSAVCKNELCDDECYNFGFELMGNCGKVIKTTEDKMDIITALSGSGPAYYYKIIELMANAAIKLGLDKDIALMLSAQTALGSAKMVQENNFDITQLIKNVTTKGGCTEVGNNVIAQSNMDEIIDKTIQDTMKKAIELG